MIKKKIKKKMEIKMMIIIKNKILHNIRKSKKMPVLKMINKSHMLLNKEKQKP
jgi:hypothetical protein